MSKTQPARTSATGPSYVELWDLAGARTPKHDKRRHADLRAGLKVKYSIPVGICLVGEKRMREALLPQDSCLDDAANFRAIDRI